MMYHHLLCLSYEVVWTVQEPWQNQNKALPNTAKSQTGKDVSVLCKQSRAAGQTDTTDATITAGVWVWHNPTSISPCTTTDGKRTRGTK